MIYAKYDSITGVILGHYIPNVHNNVFDKEGLPLDDNMISLNDSQWEKSINGGIRVNVDTKEVYDYVYSPPIEELKLEKYEWVSSQTASHITAGFVSSATGVSATYDSEQADQENIKLMHQASLSADFATDPVYQGQVPIRAIVSGESAKTILMHDKDELQALVNDLARHIGACKLRGWQLQSQVELAETKEELDALSW